MNSVNASNKLLVLIDGRSVYTPFFSSVFWDQQDVMLADVERIEVISGPGGTLWGANAMNGVINVITKSSAETQGGLVDAKIGDFVQRGAGRWGGKLGGRGHLSRLRAGLRGRPYDPRRRQQRDGRLARETGRVSRRLVGARQPIHRCRATSTKTSSTHPAAGAAAVTFSGAGTSDSPTGRRCRCRPITTSRSAPMSRRRAAGPPTHVKTLDVRGRARVHVAAQPPDRLGRRAIGAGSIVSSTRRIRSFSFRRARH